MLFKIFITYFYRIEVLEWEAKFKNMLCIWGFSANEDETGVFPEPKYPRCLFKISKASFVRLFRESKKE